MLTNSWLFARADSVMAAALLQALLACTDRGWGRLLVVPAQHRHDYLQSLRHRPQSHSHWLYLVLVDSSHCHRGSDFGCLQAWVRRAAQKDCDWRQRKQECLQTDTPQTLGCRNFSSLPMQMTHSAAAKLGSSDTVRLLNVAILQWTHMCTAHSRCGAQLLPNLYGEALPDAGLAVPGLA